MGRFRDSQVLAQDENTEGIRNNIFNPTKNTNGKQFDQMMQLFCVVLLISKILHT